MTTALRQRSPEWLEARRANFWAGWLSGRQTNAGIGRPDPWLRLVSDGPEQTAPRLAYPTQGVIAMGCELPSL